MFNRFSKNFPEVCFLIWFVKQISWTKTTNNRSTF
jgi:hypothetical protein